MLPEQKNEARRNSGVFVFAVESVFRDFLKFVFRMKLIFFGIVLISKMIFKNKKNIIFMHFRVKNTLKFNHYHTPKRYLNWLNFPLFFFSLVIFSYCFLQVLVVRRCSALRTCPTHSFQSRGTTSTTNDGNGTEGWSSWHTSSRSNDRTFFESREVT